MSLLSDALRAEFQQSDDLRDAGLRTPEEVRRWDDIPYGPDSRWQALDLYRPRQAEGRTLPVIVSVHGGGWVYGDKEHYQFYCMELARRGFAVVNFSYRLAPEHKFPAALEDANAAFNWVLDNTERYLLDRERVFAVGDSAGGNLLGLYACFCTNPAYAAQFDFRPPEGFAPKALALNCGVYHISREPLAPDEQTLQLMDDLLPGGGTDAALERVDVLAHATADFPPAFIMTCTDDFLKSQAPLMANRLMELGVPFALRVYGSRTRALGHDFQCNIRTEDARRCNDDECAFFRSFR